MSNTLGRGPLQPLCPPFPPSHHTLGSHWLALIGCIKHSADFWLYYIWSRMDWCPVLQIPEPQRPWSFCQDFRLLQGHTEGKRVSGCDCNDSRKYVTRTGMVSGVHDKTVCRPFLLALCSMWGPAQVLTKLSRPCRLPWVHRCLMSGTALWVKWHKRTSKTDFHQVRGKLFWRFKWNTSVSNPCWPLMCLPVPSVKI